MAQKTKRLTKSHDKMVSGVLGGVADYFHFDPAIVRLGFILVMALTGFFPMLFAYIVAAVVIPESKV